MSVEITFIRHGQTEGNAGGRWQGHTNTSLTDLGREQAQLLAGRLADTSYDLIVASDLDRTVETAAALDRPFDTDERWREPNFGSWEDKTTSEIAVDGTGGLAALMAGEDVALGGGERLSEVMMRTREALRDAVERVDGNGRIAVVSHGMSLLTLLSGVLDTKRPSPLRLLGNTATATVVGDGDQFMLTSYNDDTHLGYTEMPAYGRDPSDTELYLIRHGQTVSNVEGRWQGHQDGQLNDVGQDQAARLGSSFPDVDAVYASPLSRAADTASEVARNQGLNVVHDDRLKEIHFGDWEGLTTAEIMSQFPESTEFFNGADVRRGGSGETFIEVRKRVAESIDTIASTHPGQKVAVVSHGGVTRAWVTEVLGLPYTSRNRLSILSNTGYSRIAYGTRGPSIVSWNLVPHLRES